MDAILKMIENSLYEGALYQYRDPATGAGDTEAMVVHLKAFWHAIKFTWEDAWAKPPRFSRLTHGVGIQSLGYVMDRLTEDQSAAASTTSDAFYGSIRNLVAVSAWTEGAWESAEDERSRWNSLQNTPNDVRRLASHLLRALSGR